MHILTSSKSNTMKFVFLCFLIVLSGIAFVFADDKDTKPGKACTKATEGNDCDGDAYTGTCTADLVCECQDETFWASGNECIKIGKKCSEVGDCSDAKYDQKCTEDRCGCAKGYVKKDGDCSQAKEEEEEEEEEETVETSQVKPKEDPKSKAPEEAAEETAEAGEGDDQPPKVDPKETDGAGKGDDQLPNDDPKETDGAGKGDDQLPNDDPNADTSDKKEEEKKPAVPEQKSPGKPCKTETVKEDCKGDPYKETCTAKGVCECKDDTFWATGLVCQKIGKVCQKDADCKNKGEAYNGKCTDERCECATNFKKKDGICDGAKTLTASLLLLMLAVLSSQLYKQN